MLKIRNQKAHDNIKMPFRKKQVFCLLLLVKIVKIISDFIEYSQIRIKFFIHRISHRLFVLDFTDRQERSCFSFQEQLSDLMLYDFFDHVQIRFRFFDFLFCS